MGSTKQLGKTKARIPKSTEESLWSKRVICGVTHYLRKCTWCSSKVWTQSRLPGYVCRSCTDPVLKRTDF
jgi:DNA-directed RNA polymerase subunit RPC12/RpoP